MSEPPSWLSNDPESVPTATLVLENDHSPSLNESSPSHGKSRKPSSGESGDSPSAADEKDLPNIVLFMRLANMAAAAYLMTISILFMIGNLHFSEFVLCIYATCGGLLICCLETQLKFLRVTIAMNFGFLFSPFWRFVFYILMASISWQYNNILGRIGALLLLGSAFFNTYVLWKYPNYRKVREKIAEEEDRRIDAKITGQVKKQALNAMFSK